jgi:hypothetical protein
VCEFFGLETKMQHEGIDLWLKCRDGDRRAFNTMKKYNIQDVKIVRALYHKIKAWAKTHPNLARYFDYPCCERCMSYDVIYRGWDYHYKTPRQKMLCKACGHWSESKITTTK